MQIRCGIDLVSVDRIARLQRELPSQDLARIFGEDNLEAARAVRFPERLLAEQFAAKEACLKLFPLETARGDLGVEDVGLADGRGGVPRLEPGDRLRQAMQRHGIGEISLSVASCRTEACAIAVVAADAASPAREILQPAETSRPGTEPPDREETERAAEAVRALHPSLLGRAVYRCLPVRRRVVLDNMRRVFGEALDSDGYRRLAQAFYAHMGRFVLETVAYTLQGAGRAAPRISVENMEIPLAAGENGRGVIILTGHFGSWEIACGSGILRFPEYRGKFHFLRRPISNRWIEALVLRRFHRVGLGVIPKKNSLGTILDRLERGHAIVFIMDQHASVPKDGLPVDFFGRPAGTFRSLALIAKASGAPVIPAQAWREGDGSHRLRFEEPLPWIDAADPREEVLINTRVYNRALERMVLRRPEQWFWMHKRWKL